MGVVVPNPQDYLKSSYSSQPLISSPPMKPPRNHKSNRVKPDRRNRTVVGRSSATSPQAASKAMSRNLVMGQVKILKRVDPLTETVPESVPKAVEMKSYEYPDLGTTDRLGPEPDLVSTQIRVTDESNRVASFYAGSSVFVASPPPSSLPLPAFFTKKNVSSINVDATNKLLSILRLDLS